MKMKWFRAAAPVAALSIVAGGAVADESARGDELSDLRRQVEQLQKQLAIVPELRREIEILQRRDDDAWLTERRAEEVRDLVEDVLADADTRASLLGSNLAAGWDGGFYLASDDGNFRLRIGGQLQVRFVYSSQNDSPEDDHRWGFENRRTRLLLSGHIIDPTWTYDIQLAVDRDSGIMRLEDAGWIQKDLGGGLRLRAGQMKAPYMREETLSSIRMMAVERSLLNAQFTAGLVQGVMLWWGNENLRLYVMYHDDNRSGNTAWQVEGAEFAASARAEWLVHGEWQNFIDYASFRDEGKGLLIGAAINYAKDEFGTATPNEVRNIGVTADITADLGGLNLSAIAVYRNLRSIDVDFDQLGFLLRAGVFITEKLELYGQYEWGDLDTGAPDLSVITIGAAHYFAKHRLKWQSDIGYSFNELSEDWALTGAGWREDSAGEDGQFIFRSQLQLVF